MRVLVLNCKINHMTSYSDQRRLFGFGFSSWCLLTLLTAFYFVTRLMSLDADIPNWDISYYSPIDEFYYTQFAFDLVEGIHTPDGTYFGKETPYFNLFQQLFTASSLYIFGDNYYGLRLPSVMAGLVVFVIFLGISIQRFGNATGLIFGVVLLTEISFLLSNRIAEPTIFRIAIASILLAYIVWAAKNRGTSFVSSIKFDFITGLLCAAGTVYVYPSNAFIVLAGALSVLWLKWDSTPADRIKAIGYYAAGCALSVLSYLCVLIFLFDSDVDSIRYVVKLTDSRVASTMDLMAILKSCYMKLYNIKYAGFFRLSPHFLQIFLLCIFLAAVRGLYILWGKYKSEKTYSLNAEDVGILLFLATLLGQTMFLNDYPERKLVAAFPLILYLCFWALEPFAVRLEHAGRKWPIAVALLFLPLSIMHATVSVKEMYGTGRNYVEAMKGLSYLGSEHVGGGISFGFRLYNDYKPFLNAYSYSYDEVRTQEYFATLKSLAESGYSKYTINYDDEITRAQLAPLGFVPSKKVFISNDKTYPDVVLYSYKNSERPGVNESSSADYSGVR